MTKRHTPRIEDFTVTHGGDNFQYRWEADATVPRNVLNRQLRRAKRHQDRLKAAHFAFAHTLLHTCDACQRILVKGGNRG